MAEEGPATADPRAPWPVAVFAHNEARTIAACLDSLERAAAGHPLTAYVLANGCRDATARIVRDYAAAGHPWVRLVEIALGDKANAWNEYVHALAPAAPIHFFIDGDVRAGPEALAHMAASLAAAQAARAISAIPSTGRSYAHMARHMMAGNMVGGNLYALSPGFVAQLRAETVRLPVGFIGEDWLVTCLVKGDFTPRALHDHSPYLASNLAATFAFRSLSPWRPRDWRIYARRLVRYQLREHQFRLLDGLWLSEPVLRLPASVDQLYAEAATLPAYRWRGVRRTVFDVMAVRQIRRRAARS